MFFPVLIDPERGAVLGTGEPLPFEQTPNFDKKIKGLTAVWPVRKDLSLGNWGVGHITLRQLIDKGYVSLGEFDPKRRSWGITYLSRRHRDQIDAGVLQKFTYDEERNVIDVVYGDPQMRRIKRVWHRSSHDAGAGGSDLLRTFLGGERRFAFPKSLYAVRDALAAVVATRPDSLILDFFAGSGTTLHATTYLNAQDGGRRQCILVTNNELSAEDEKRLAEAGHLPGDAEYEKHGVFEAVARPRIEAALTGKLPDGTNVVGEYLNGRPFAQGFDENCEFFRLDYLDPDKVELGRSFDALHPLFWLRAGARGARPKRLRPREGFAIVEAAGYAILFDEAAMPELTAALNAATGVDHVFLRTDSDDAYAEMRALLGPGIATERLYDDYLDEFRRGVRFTQ
jgi:adenine-specific DNA-methyltransferase